MLIQILVIVLVGLAIYLAGRLVHRGGRAPLPPGPSGWPLIGNLLDIRMHAPYKTLGAMSDKYGPIVSLSMLGKRFIVLNSSKAAKDLLEKRSVVTSDRPHTTVAGDLVGWGNFTGLLQYGETHRKHRKFFARHIGTHNRLEMFHPIEEAEARRFALNVLKNPDNLIAHCDRTTASLVLKITYGYDATDENDQIIKMARRAVYVLSQALALGRFLADFIPTLRYLPGWFPGGGFHKDVKQWRNTVSDSVNAPYQFVLEHLTKGDAIPSFTSRLLQEGIPAEDEGNLKWASFGLYLGGADATPSILSSFFLAMAMHPEVLRKAQAEVHAIVGNFERLPTKADQDALPYVTAICTELLRWSVLVPMPPHASTQDIIYEGYLIPQGSWLLPNIWFILSDPETYPDPEVFNPERFLGDDQQLDPHEACFGWGRRQCPGALLADSMIFTYVIIVLATMEISRHVENGVKCMPKHEFEEGMIRRLKPFKCKILPRAKAEDLLHP